MSKHSDKGVVKTTGEEEEVDESLELCIDQVLAHADFPNSDDFLRARASFCRYVEKECKNAERKGTPTKFRNYLVQIITSPKYDSYQRVVLTLSQSMTFRIDEL